MVRLGDQLTNQLNTSLARLRDQLRPAEQLLFLLQWSLLFEGKDFNEYIC